MGEDHYATFLEESTELLADLEASLVELEDRPQDGELVGRIFRALHTIKGSAGIFGLDTLSWFVHRFESVFELVRNEELKVSRDIINLGLKGVDLINKLLRNPEGTVSIPDDLLEGLNIEGIDNLEEGQFEIEAYADALDVSGYANLLTEYELSRVRTLAKKGTILYLLNIQLPLETLSQELSSFTRTISMNGELISSIPLTDPAPPGHLGFNLIFSHSQTVEELTEAFGCMPEIINTRSLLGIEKNMPVPKVTGRKGTYRIRFSPKPKSFASGLDPLALIDELKQLGDCVVVAQTKKVPELEVLDPAECYIFWDIILSSECDLDQIKDIFIFLEEGHEVRVDKIDDGSKSGNDSYKRLGEILVERGDISLDELSGYLNSQKQLGQVLVEANAVPPRVVESALIEQSYMKDLLKERQKSEVSQSIRVPAEKLDMLVNLAGEMVTLQARLHQCAIRYANREMRSIAEDVERLTNDLRDTTLNIRMLPIGTTFSRFKRVVRDLGAELGKNVQLTTAGGETELDKTVIEKLNDPLIHLIRNSIDHGIENSEQRRASGKSTEGNIHLAAVHAGDSVLITISDDGRGLNYESIKAKAVARGLISEGSQLTEREIGSFIFLPGFSTAETISDLSGRGVGMDVVKRSIDSLRGSIDIKSTEGQGTKIIIKLPLTLVIIESLLVKIGQERFALPLSVVEECVALDTSKDQGSYGNLIAVRGQLIPYVHLRQRFNIQTDIPELQQIVILNHDGQRVGVSVDHVVGQYQAVIKPLGKLYEDIEEISGATILGDGTIALIIDVSKMIQRFGQAA